MRDKNIWKSLRIQFAVAYFVSGLYQIELAKAIVRFHQILLIGWIVYTKRQKGQFKLHKNASMLALHMKSTSQRLRRQKPLKAAFQMRREMIVFIRRLKATSPKEV